MAGAKIRITSNEEILMSIVPLHSQVSILSECLNDLKIYSEEIQMSTHYIGFYQNLIPLNKGG